ncbi:MAG: ABC transporter ATP-binding protein [Synergistaceae bacterium]|nr:ABC transporter ATP-binding protein [Synergistaceae bacterium]
MANDIVEFRHITKRFPGIVANDDVSLSVKEGEIFAVLGENGAGKSTLVSMLFGMYEPDGGEIYVRGKLEHINSPRYAGSLGIGMVHQHFRLVSNYTVAENIVLGLEPVKKIFGVIPYVDMKKANRDIAELSERYGLKVNPTDVIENLNVATQQRVEILKMLYREAEILIFDEPTAVLTPQEIKAFLWVIDGLREQGKTIILITHKLNKIKAVADRCAIMNRGKLIDVLDVATSSTDDMARMMVGRDVSFTTERKPAKFGDVILDVKGLTVKNSAGIEAVKSVSFQIHAGEVFAVAGVSGNGQNELADSVAGLVTPSGGTVTLNGHDITRSTVREHITAGVAYIPEDRHNVGLVLDFRLKDNFPLRQYYTGKFSRKGIISESEFESYGKKLEEAYDIRSSLGGDTITREMSGGNQQKAIIAREIDMKTPLIIFMQPTRGLDAGAVMNIHKHIVAERDRGAAVLLISLDLDEIQDCADTIAVIYNGSINKIAPASEISTDEIGLYMMGVKTE